MERLDETRIGCAWWCRSSVSLVLSVSQCLAHGSFHTPLLPSGFKASGLGRFQPAACSQHSVSDQVAYSRLWTTVRASVGFWKLSSWLPGMLLAKVRTKVKRKWRNSLSGQNAIISPRATNLLGRGSWFACARAINCICRWQSPSHSGLKRSCWLSLAFVGHFVISRAFSQFMVSLIPNKVSLSSQCRNQYPSLYSFNHWGDWDTQKESDLPTSYSSLCCKRFAFLSKKL